MKNQNETSSSNSEQSSAAASCCAAAGSIREGELKVYQAFTFSIPVFFTFALLFSFYLFYLRRRRRRQNGSSSSSDLHLQLPGNHVSRTEQGLKKELREMLPIIVFMESFSVRETQCSVCLADYQAEDRLQQIPSCGHTFHMGCIDHWLASHTTCPLCRLSLLASSKADIQIETSNLPPIAGHADEASAQDCYHSPDNLQRIP